MSQRPHSQRPKAPRVSRHDQPVFSEQGQRVGPLQAQQGFSQGVLEALFPRPRHQVQDHFRIAAGLEDGTAGFELAPQIDGVRQIAVVRYGDLPLAALHKKRLRIETSALTRSGVSRMADGHVARKTLEHRFGEDFGHQSHSLPTMDLLAVARAHPGAFLPSML